ncbi:hypothetical protein [Effusibacillus consociatus]|uniref:Fibronectin type-III domain-containing protein n=1 Tax=Effusibacillus consociatus TaxID=1117041 RepID=A0ABV9Q2N4_9BACL
MPTNQTIIGEALNKRTKNSKHYLLVDGSYQAVIYSGDIHYEDEAGNLHNINTDLFDEADFDQIEDPVYKGKVQEFREKKAKVRDLKKKNSLDRALMDFHALKVPFSASIPRNFRKGYTIGKGPDKLTFKPVGTSPSQGYREPDKTNCVVYQDPWNDTDVCLEITDRGIKETLHLKTNKAPTKFTFEVVGNLADDLTAGMLKLQPAWLEDANGTRRDVSQVIRRENEKTYIDMVADVTGLTYPIMIDPTVTIGSVGTGVGKDSYLNDYDASTTNHGSDTQLLLGTSANTSGVTTVYYSFDLSSITGPASSAYADIYRFSQTSVSFTIYHYVVNSDWTESTLSNGNKPTMTYLNTNTAIFGTGGGKVRFNGLEGYVNKWWGQASNGGFALRVGTVTGESQSVYFASKEYSTSSTYYPTLTVVYNPAPTAPTVTAPNGGETWNASHTITWNGATDQSSPEVDLGYTLAQSTYNGLSSTVTKIWQVFTVPSDSTYLDSVEWKLNGYTSPDQYRVSIYNVDANDNVTTEVWGINQSHAQTGTPPPLSVGISLTAGAKYALSFGYISPYNSISLSQADKTGSTVRYYNGSYGSIVNSTLRARLNFATKSPSQLQYQIQYSGDNGATWSDIVALTAAGATSYTYDFTSKPQTSTALIRIRAYDGSAYGAWDQSNGVFSIIHNTAPTAPTNLAPANGTPVDRALVQRLSWQHNDPNAPDPQSKFDLQWRLQATPANPWNTVTQVTTNQYWDAPANTFPRGTIEWQVRTYDQAGLSGPYSAQQTFFAGDKPANPTITDPANNGTVAIARPTVQWSSSGQTNYQLQIKQGSTVVWDSGYVVSTNKAVTVGTDLSNNTTYTANLRIKNADGLWSDYVTNTFTVSFTPPATPTITATAQTGYIAIAITNPTPTGAQPTVSGNDVYRRKVGDTAWTRIKTGVANNGTYNDYAVASGVTYEYYVRAQGSNTTYTDSTTASSSITLTGVWLHDVADPVGTLYNFQWDGDGRSSTWKPEGGLMKYDGRDLPVAEFGTMTEQSATVQLDLRKEDSDYAKLQTLIFGLGTLCYRDGNGRKIFGVVFELPENDQMWGRKTTIRVDAIDHEEAV